MRLAALLTQLYSTDSVSASGVHLLSKDRPLAAMLQEHIDWSSLTGDFTNDCSPGMATLYTTSAMWRDLPYNLSMTSESLEVEHLFGDCSENGVLCLKGPLTFENLPKFQNAIRRENVPTVILDLTDVPYIDSAGLGSLVSAHVSRHKMGRRMALSGVNARIIHLLEITRMDQLFLVFPSLSDAIDALNNPGMA